MAGRDFGCESNRVAVGGRLVTLWTPGGRYEDVLVPLHGAHQGVNAAVALAAVEAFFGTALAPEVVEEGLASVRVPGRLEVLGRRPLLLVDGAHNAAGMAALADALTEEFAVEGVSVAVVGMLSGRDPSAMLAPLASAGVTAIVACEPESPRAMPGGCGRGSWACPGSGRVRGARRAQCAAGGAAGWSVPTGSSWSRDRSMSSARRAPMRSRRPCHGRTPAADGGGPAACRLCSVDPSWTAPLSL